MILTKVEKKTVVKKYKRGKKLKSTHVIRIEGRSYLEASLINYIKTIRIKERSVFLMEMKDTFSNRSDLKNTNTSKQMIFSHKKETNLSDTGVLSQSEMINYIDTLNNRFVLEIK